MTSFALADHGLMVDSDGNVYGPDGVIPPKKIGGGYRAVTAGGKQRYIHRLIATAFLDNPENKPQVAHWDANRSNNELSNLRWATQSENESDKVRAGTDNSGERNGQARLSDSDADDIRRLREYGTRVESIARTFGVSKWTIYDVCNPKRRKR